MTLVTTAGLPSLIFKGTLDRADDSQRLYIMCHELFNKNIQANDHTYNSFLNDLAKWWVAWWTQYIPWLPASAWLPSQWHAQPSRLPLAAHTKPLHISRQQKKTTLGWVVNGGRHLAERQRELIPAATVLEMRVILFDPSPPQS
jgi:hypothetical protein